MLVRGTNQYGPEKTMLVKEAKEIVGSLGDPTKMPGFSYGLPACKASWVPEYCKKLNLPIPADYGCKVGQILSDLPNTPCFKCYADGRGNYSYESVKHGQLLRLIGTYHPRWKEAMIMLIDRYIDYDDPYFRWLDSGDIPHRKMLLDIIEIAKELPFVNFWLPTQERKQLHGIGKIPPNLCVRVSHIRLDDHDYTSNTWYNSSSVSTEGHDYLFDQFTCPSDQYSNTCGPCRKCWDTANRHTIYHIH